MKMEMKMPQRFEYESSSAYRCGMTVLLTMKMKNTKSSVILAHEERVLCMGVLRPFMAMNRLHERVVVCVFSFLAY